MKKQNKAVSECCGSEMKAIGESAIFYECLECGKPWRLKASGVRNVADKSRIPKPGERPNSSPALPTKPEWDEGGSTQNTWEILKRKLKLGRFTIFSQVRTRQEIKNEN